jgi:hypothetical protein
VATERPPERLGDPVPGDVVAGRAQAAGEDDHVGSGQREADGLGDPAHVVPHRLLVEDVDPDVRQAGRDLCGVGVHDLAEEDLGSDPDDLGSHPGRAALNA